MDELRGALKMIKEAHQLISDTLWLDKNNSQEFKAALLDIENELDDTMAEITNANRN